MAEKLCSINVVFQACMSKHIYLIDSLFSFGKVQVSLPGTCTFFSLHLLTFTTKVTHRWLLGMALLEMRS